MSVSPAIVESTMRPPEDSVFGFVAPILPIIVRCLSWPFFFAANQFAAKPVAFVSMYVVIFPWYFALSLAARSATAASVFGGLATSFLFQMITIGSLDTGYVPGACFDHAGS